MIAPVVVTGASGFIGGAVVDELARAGIPVVAVARRRLESEDGVAVEQVSDYRDTPVPPGSTIVHLAEKRETGETVERGQNVGQSQLALIVELLAKPCERFVYVSSAAIYGDSAATPHVPDQPSAPTGDYGRMKVSCERQVLAREGGTVVRLSNVFGPGMSGSNVVSDILRQIPGDGALEVRDAGSVRDFVWVGDVARGLVRIAGDGSGGIFNLGSGRGISVGDLAALALKIAGQSHRPVVSTRPSCLKSTLVLDISQTTEIFDWRPHVTFAEGLEILLRQAA